MDNNYRKILSDHPSIPPEKLLAYLEGRLDEQTRLEVEMAMVESEFLSDAADGLKQFKNPDGIANMVEDINRGLRKQARNRRRSSWTSHAGFPLWLTFAAILLLLLLIAGFFVLRLLTKD
jgi:hypothetical protein